MRANEAATAYLEGLGYDVQDTSANKPYDLVGRRKGARVFVDVKGTTTAGEKVFLTKNEVRS